MADLYQIDILRKTGTTSKQRSYDVVAKILVIDSNVDDEDEWMMMSDSRGQIASGNGHWFLATSQKKIVLTAKVEHGQRNEASLHYESWPLRAGQMGKFTTYERIRYWDVDTEYEYFVYKVS